MFSLFPFSDKTRHYYTLCRAASPVDTPPCGTPTKELLTQPLANVIHEEDDEGIPEMEYEDEFLDPNSAVVETENEISEEEEKEIIEVPNTDTDQNTVEKNNSKNTDQGLVNDSGKDDLLKKFQ